MTKRQSIVNLFITLAKTITTVNGYLSNFASDEVHHWKDVSLDKDVTQYLNIKDGINEQQDGDVGTYQVMEIKIEFGCKGTDLYDTVTNMIQSVYKMAYDNQDAFNNKFGYFRILPVEDDFEIIFDKSEEFAEGHVTFEVWHTAQNKWILDETVWT